MKTGNFIISFFCAMAMIAFTSCLQDKKGPFVKKEILFSPDTTINKLIIDDITANSSKIKQIEWIKDIRMQPVALFFNRDKSEYLLAYQSYKINIEGFRFFEVGYTAKQSQLLQKEGVVLQTAHFKTESGIQLGVSSSLVHKKKGKPHETAFTKGNQLQIDTYRLSPSHPYVAKHHATDYRMELTYRSDTVILFKFGFDE